MKKLLPIGKLSRLFGDEGAMMLSLYDTFKGEKKINKEEPLFVKIDKLSVPFFVEEFERRGQSGALIRFADIDNQMRASELLDKEVLMKAVVDKKADSSDSDSLYYDDLVGFKATVIVESGEGEPIRGEVVEFVDSEMNPLLIINVEQNEVMIPANDQLISFIDVDSERIEFEVPEGLLELYIDN